MEIEKFDGKVTEHKFPDGNGTWKRGNSGRMGSRE